MISLGHGANRYVLMFLGSLIAVAALAASVAVVVGQQGGDAPVDLDAGLTDEERDAKYRRLSEQSAVARSETVKEFVAGDLDITALPRVESSASYLASDLTLEDATATAEFVVLATVVEQRVISVENWAIPGHVVSKLSIDKWLKGDSGEPFMEVEQVGMPLRMPDGSHALQILNDDPVFALGSQVIVFVKEESDATYTFNQALPFKTLEVKNGSVEPNPLDEAFRPLKGQSLDILEGTIRAWAAAQ